MIRALIIFSLVIEPGDLNGGRRQLV